MARVELPLVVIDPQNPAQLVASAVVTIKNRVDETLATLYQAETGSGTRSNPTTSDTAGRVNCWLERGRYEITVQIPGRAPLVENFDSSSAADGSTPTEQLADHAVTQAKMAAASVGSAEIIDANVGTSELADGAATTAKLGDASVTPVKVNNALKPSAGASDSTEALRSLGTLAGQALAATDVRIPSLVSTLPGSPVNGQQIYFQTSTMLSSGRPPWLLRFNTGAASPYRWEVISAVPFGVSSTTTADTFTTSYTDLTSASIGTMPLSGLYWAQWSIEFDNSNAPTFNIWVAPNLGTIPNDGQALNATIRSAAGRDSSTHSGGGQFTATAGQTGRLQARNDAGTVSGIIRKTLSVVPQRVG